jgi:hypothetical protein
MAMIRRATGRIENVADSNEREGVIVCRACSHIVFRVNLGANNSCPFCHRDASVSIETPVVADADFADDDDNDPDVIAIKC